MRLGTRSPGLVLAALVAGGLVTGVATPARAAVPQTITFTAHVDDGGVPLDGTHAFEFKLYVALPPNPMIWAESRALDVVDGKVDVELGAVESLAGVFTGMPLELEVVVDGTVLAPRTRVASVPYALRAELAESVVSFGGLAPDDYQGRVTGACGSGFGVGSINPDGSVGSEAVVTPGGDITSVLPAPGGGLSGGASSGAVTLGLMSCAPGAVLMVRPDGQWNCADPDASSGACGAGQHLRGYDNLGTPICEVGGDITAITTSASGGLSGGSASGDVSLRLRDDCAPGQILRRPAANPTVWECADAPGASPAVKFLEASTSLTSSGSGVDIIGNFTINVPADGHLVFNLDVLVEPSLADPSERVICHLEEGTGMFAEVFGTGRWRLLPPVQFHVDQLNHFAYRAETAGAHTYSVSCTALDGTATFSARHLVVEYYPASL